MGPIMSITLCDRCGDVTVGCERCRCATPHDPVSAYERLRAAIARGRERANDPGQLAGAASTAPHTGPDHTTAPDGAPRTDRRPAVAGQAGPVPAARAFTAPCRAVRARERIRG